MKKFKVYLPEKLSNKAEKIIISILEKTEIRKELKENLNLDNSFEILVNHPKIALSLIEEMPWNESKIKYK